MAKRRKTRRQKIITDLRQKTTVTSGESLSPTQESTAPSLATKYTFSSSHVSKNQSPKNIPLNASDQAHYAYVRKDLIKTLSVTSCILVIQVAIFLISR